MWKKEEGAGEREKEGDDKGRMKKEKNYYYASCIEEKDLNWLPASWKKCASYWYMCRACVVGLSNIFYAILWLLVRLLLAGVYSKSSPMAVGRELVRK